MAGVCVAAMAVVITTLPGIADAGRFEGRIYRATNAEPVAGATVRLFFDQADPTAPGALVPDNLLGAGQQGQTTSRDGRYAFDAAAGRAYRIVVGVDRISMAFPSSLVPPRPGFAPLGDVVPNNEPAPAEDPAAARSYYLRFTVGADSDVISNNHIPVDPLAAVVSLEKRADRSNASVGDVINYTITVVNRSARNLTSADGQQTFILDAPPRGFSFVRRSAVARIVVGEQETIVSSGLDTLEGVRSKRLVRFGPFDLPAGATLTLRYQTVISTDTRPGRYANRAVLIDPGGVELSPESVASVRVVPDRTFESGLVIGRVFCDADGDGEFDSGERGVMGARVYSDTGSYAVTDSAGLYHLSRLDPGTHLVKLDPDTLAGGKATSDISQLLRMSKGLTAKANFGVKCVGERVSIDHRRTEITHSSLSGGPTKRPATVSRNNRVVLSGELVGLRLQVDGEKIDLPSATATLSVPSALRFTGTGKASNLVEVPAAGYGRERPTWTLNWSMPKGVTARTWLFTIEEVTASGELKPFFDIGGRGVPPTKLSWDGSGSGGKRTRSNSLYAAQLTVVGDRRNAEAASARNVFGVAFGRGAAPSSQILRGRLFRGRKKAPKVTSRLKKEIELIIAKLGPDDTLLIESHWDGTGERLKAIARTQREAAEVKRILEAGGIDATRIKARGRGSLEPVNNGTNRASRQENRRLVFIIQRPQRGAPGQSLPTTVAGAADVLIDGELVAVDERGHFRTSVDLGPRGAVLVDIRALDGRRAAIDAPVVTEHKEAATEQRPVRVEADLSAMTVKVDFLELSAQLLSIDAKLASMGGSAAPNIGITGSGLSARLANPLDFTILASKDLAVRSWTLIVVDRLGNRLHRASGKAGPPPASHRWDGTNAKGQVLVAGGSYRYWFSVVTSNGARGQSPVRSFTVGTPASPPVSSPVSEPSVHVNGVPLVEKSGVFVGEVSVPLRGAVIVDITTRSGNRATLVEVADRKRDDNWVKDSDLLPLDDEPRVPVDVIAPGIDYKADFRSAAAANIHVMLPPEGTELGSRDLAVTGVTAPGNRVTINGRAVLVRSDGHFSSIVELPVGDSDLVLRSVDKAGYIVTIRWPVKVASQQTFVLALGEGIVASAGTSRGLFGDTAFLPGMNADSTMAAGQFLLHGRGVLYLKTRLSGGDLFDEVRLTAHLDTARRRGQSAFFEELVDAVRDHAIYGDSSREVRDVNNRGKLYMRLEAGESSAVLGSVHTSLRGGSLFRYDRTFDGAVVDIKKDVGSHRVEVKSFGTRHRANHVRDINWYRATGGSLYYLRHNQVLEGSERLRVVVRDRDNGLVLSERILVRDLDYTLDYPGGRILLNRPLASVVSSAWILDNFDSTTMVLDGHPVYLEARYEHSDPTAPEQRAGGLYARDTIGGKLSLGAGAMVEERDGGGDYSLWGVDAVYRLGESSVIKAEVAGSRRRDASNYLSQDGGLSFDDLNSIATTTGAGDDNELAWKVSADIKLADFTDVVALAGTSVRIYGQELDRGFSSGGTLLEQGRLKFGATVRHRLGKYDEIAVRHESEIANLPQVGPTQADVDSNLEPLATIERASYTTSLQWAHLEGKWSHRFEVGQQRITSDASLADGGVAIDTRRLGLGAATGYQLTERLQLRVGQQLVIGIEDEDPVLMPIDPMTSAQRDEDVFAGITTKLGGSLKLTDDIQLGADYLQRWNGDNAAQFGLRSALSDRGSMYVSQRLSSRSGRMVSTSIIGADDRFGTGGKTYGEYQLENGALGLRNRAVLGLGNRWRVGDHIRLNIGYEHQQSFGGFLPDGTPAGENLRDVVHTGADVLLGDTFRAAAQLELRFDDGVSGDGIESLIANDPRGVGTDVFPDHGGTAPGAPLVLQPGERIQVVGGIGADWKWTPDATMFGRLRVSNTSADDDSSDGGFDTIARYAEGSLGAVYRPLDKDWLQLLIRYSYILDERQLTASAISTESRSHVASFVPVIELPWRLRLSGKLALKTSQSAITIASGDEIDNSADAVLGLVRIGYRLIGNLDATVEYRHLLLFKPVGDESDSGALVELGYSIRRFVRLGIGYNLSRFSDDELGDLQRDSHGFFMRLTGHY